MTSPWNRRGFASFSTNGAAAEFVIEAIGSAHFAPADPTTRVGTFVLHAQAASPSGSPSVPQAVSSQSRL